MKNNLREINILKGINLAKLPFKILDKDLFNFTKDLSIKIKEIFSLLNKKESLKWCFSSQKKSIKDIFRSFKVIPFCGRKRIAKYKLGN